MPSRPCPWVSRGGNAQCFGFISFSIFLCAAARPRACAQQKNGPKNGFFWPAPFFFSARPFVCAIPRTTKPGPPACACVIVRFTYEVSFVHLPGRGGLTCTRCARHANRFRTMASKSLCTEFRGLSKGAGRRVPDLVIPWTCALISACATVPCRSEMPHRDTTHVLHT